MAIICLALASCTHKEIVHNTNPPPPPRENSITVEGKSYRAEQLLYSVNDIVYPPDEATEPSVSFRIIANGAIISADIPTRLVEHRIDLTSRDANPSPGSDVYYTFHITVRGENAAYYRVLSWEEDDNPDKLGPPYGGWFSISYGNNAEEWGFEWELTNRQYGSIISTGYVKGEFEQIP